MKPIDLLFQDKAKGILRAELGRRNLNYDQLAEKLSALGIEDNARNLSNKIARGGFTAGFFVACLQAIGCHILHIHDE